MICRRFTKTILWGIFFFISLLSPLRINANTSILINELMTRNVSSVINEKFNYESWVEIYNSGSESFDLANCVFSDGEDHVWECELKKTLEPGDFFVFYFDELNTTIHSNFKLDSDGGELYLMSNDGMIFDMVKYPKGIRNISYGRISDGEEDWGYKEIHTPGYSNNGIRVYSEQTESPSFSIPSGFYQGVQKLVVTTSQEAKIYYTTDGSEPKPIEKYLYKDTILLDKNMPIRAIAIADNSLPSKIITNSYFINERTISLPVISLVSDPLFLYSDSLGIMTKGLQSNWTVSMSCGSNSNVMGNYMEDWDRPINFELFDDQTTCRVGIELRGAISGNCSRQLYPRSLKLKANKTYSEKKKIDYKFFQDKPNQKTRSILLRNSGNDGLKSYMRDALVHSLLMGQMDIDYQSYSPSVVFVNGSYHGLLNIRERSNEDYVYSNYGYDEEEVDFPDQYKLSSIDCYKSVRDIYSKSDIVSDSVYEEIDNVIDVDEFLNYIMTETYCANSDWAGNNVKLWKRKKDGKWRWILFDTDFGFGLYGSYNHYTMDNADQFVTFKKLIKNKKLSRKFISKNIIHLATTFSSERVNYFIDSLSFRISDEIDYFYTYAKKLGYKTSDWNNEISQLRTFANKRPLYQFENLKKYFSLGKIDSLTITSNREDTRYYMNDELVNVSTLKTKCYDGFPLKIKPVSLMNKQFSYWEVTKFKENKPFSYIDSSLILCDTFSSKTCYRAVYENINEDGTTPIEYLRINEICISNDSIKDEFGEMNDWIEIYNGADTPVSLSGLYITDTKNDLIKYQFPKSVTSEDSAMMMIPSKGYKILWADNQTEQGPLHLNFALSQKEIETIVLSTKNEDFTNVIDKVSYELHGSGNSYAYFVNDSSTVWKTTSYITFCGQNQIVLVCPSDTIINKIYDGTLLQPTASVNGEYIGEEVKINYRVRDDMQWHDKAPSMIDVGEQVVEVQAVHSNYEMEKCEYTLFISKADLEVICPLDSELTKEYDGIKYQPQVSVEGLYEGDTVTIEYCLDDDSIWSTMAPDVVEVGTYVVKVRALNPNYEIAECEYVMTISDSLKEEMSELKDYLSKDTSFELKSNIYCIYDMKGRLVRKTKNVEELYKGLFGTYLVCIYREGVLVMSKHCILGD